MLHKSWLELNFILLLTHMMFWKSQRVPQLSIMPRFLQRGHTMCFISLSGNARTPNKSLEFRKNHSTKSFSKKIRDHVDIPTYFFIFSGALFESPFVSFWLSSLWVVMKYHTSFYNLKIEFTQQTNKYWNSVYIWFP